MTIVLALLLVAPICLGVRNALAEIFDDPRAFLIGAIAYTPRPCIAESRASISGEVANGRDFLGQRAARLAAGFLGWIRRTR